MKQLNKSINLKSLWIWTISGLWYNIIVDRYVKYMPFYILRPCKQPQLDDSLECFFLLFFRGWREIVAEYEIKIFFHCNSEIIIQGILCHILLSSCLFTGIDQI